MICRVFVYLKIVFSISTTMIFSLLILCLLTSFSDASLSKIRKVLHKLPDPLNVVFQNKCIENVGCFYTGPPFFDPINRPISLTPTSDLQTKFLLYTPTNPEVEELLKPTMNSIKQSSFDPKLPVKVLIPGYNVDSDLEDFKKLKNSLLKHGDYNVIIVDWTHNNDGFYPQAVANSRAVGAELGHFLICLMKITHVKPDDIHLIGHSLGAHIAGYAGQDVPNLGRITGLDPAGPLFQNVENCVRLDSTDAQFVDVIHTNGDDTVLKGLGLADPIGDMDFYPNGGMSQPGCVLTSSKNNIAGEIINATTEFLPNRCDHGRARKFFEESIDNSKCHFTATLCKSYEDFKKGNCHDEKPICAEMGFHAKKIFGIPCNSKFYLNTNEEPPFCVNSSEDR